MNFSPICIFAYNRPAHFLQVVESLKSNPEASDSLLYIFVDKVRNPTDEEKSFKILEYAKNIVGFKEVIVVPRTRNYGLAASIIDGVSSVLKTSETVIVLEDDLIVSKHFLNYMNTALNLYRDERNVASIHGYVYPVKTNLPETFFLRGSDCWGWATWKRAWDFFESDGSKLLQQLKEKKLEYYFNFNDSYPYVRMLEDQILGKNNSWAIRWYASAFVNEMYTLYPGRSLVSNIGHDGSGENCEVSDFFNVGINKTPICVIKIKIEESSEGYAAFKNYFKSLKTNPVKRLFSFIKRRL